MEKEVLQVNMLGGFNLIYEGKSFSIERNNTTKVNQLFQILLYYRGGIDRLQLIEHLFDGEVITNPSNSLRALVFRLRKILPEAGLPNDEYVNISKGVYAWTKEIPLSCDAHIFEEKAKEALAQEDQTKRKEMLQNAIDLYKGSFLPMLTGATWTIEIDTRLKNLYSDCTEQLCEIYSENREYEKLLEVSEKAARLYPYNEWQYYQMQALIELKREKEAIRLYEKTENMMFEELGVSVSKEMTAMLDRLGAQVKNRTELISEVKNNLETTKKDVGGAFYCSYPTFLESYRYIKRLIAREEQNAWLMLATITDGKGYALEAGNRLDELSAELNEAILKSCRGVDLFTKYSDNQYIILLLGIDKENCSIVQNRITGNMCKESRKRYIQYHLAPVNQAAEETKELDKILSTIDSK